MTPDDRKYMKSHEWVKIEGDLAVVGITDHAQEQLGDITFVELPDTGKQVQQGGEAAVIESVKAASDIYAPVGGEVAETNTALDEAPEQVNESPYEQGWIFKLKGFDAAALDGLLSAADYEASLEQG
jgi:glycine cleavage system H protein